MNDMGLPFIIENLRFFNRFKHKSHRVKKVASQLFILMTTLSTFATNGYVPETGHIPLTKFSLTLYQQCLVAKGQVSPFDISITDRIVQGNIAMDHGTASFNSDDNNLAYALLTFHPISRVTNWHFFTLEDNNHNPNSRINQFEMSHKRLWQWANLGFTQAELPKDKALFVGALIHLTEDISVPAHTVPVYHGPSLIGSFSAFKPLVDYGEQQAKVENGWGIKLIGDQIDKMQVNQNQLQQRLTSQPNICSSLNHVKTPEQIRYQLAVKTKQALNQPIKNCDNHMWSAFWPKTDNTSDAKALNYFGKYQTEPLFNHSGNLKNQQGEICRFSDNDPRYQQFVNDRHLDAIRANLQLLHWFYSQLIPIHYN